MSSRKPSLVQWTDLRRAPRHVVGNGDRSRARRVVGGFSLLEVLVAFVILSLVATALFRLFSGALANASASDDYSRAVLVAESVLAEAASAQPLREGTWQGQADDGRIAWTTRIVPYVVPEANPDIESASESMATRLFRVSTEVNFAAPNGGQRSFSLATTRIAHRENR